MAFEKFTPTVEITTRKDGKWVVLLHPGKNRKDWHAIADPRLTGGCRICVGVTREAVEEGRYTMGYSSHRAALRGVERVAKLRTEWKI